jgi:putative tryptophan/tyrosine transport system permease protein
MEFLLDSALLGLEYALLAVGVYISFRILNIPDLTVDGSFALGIAVSAACTAGGHPFFGLFAAIICGALAGAVTGLLHTKAHIHAILAGILTMSALYTVNIKILGGPNVSLLDSKKVFDIVASWFPPLGLAVSKALCAAAVCIAAVGALTLFFRTVAGLCIRAAGDNEDMVRASSVDTALAKTAALALSNSLVALSGGILAQYQGFGDVNSGSGMIVIGLASVIIGEVVFGRRSVFIGLLSAVFGSVIYRVIIALALQYNLFSADALKLISAVIVAVTLSVPAIREAAAKRFRRREV